MTTPLASALKLALAGKKSKSSPRVSAQELQAYLEMLKEAFFSSFSICVNCLDFARVISLVMTSYVES